MAVSYDYRVDYISKYLSRISPCSYSVTVIKYIVPYPIGDALYPNSYRTSTSARPCATQHTPALQQTS